MNFKLVVAAGLLFAFQGVQGKGEQGKAKRPPPGDPEARRVLPPAKGRQDAKVVVTPRAPGRSLEGYYSMRSFTVEGRPVARSKGYLAIGRKHLSLHLFAERGDGPPAFQTGFRSYTISGDKLITASMLGMRNDADGDVLLDKRGMVAVCRFRRAGPRLTLLMDGGHALEFERIE